MDLIRTSQSDILINLYFHLSCEKIMVFLGQCRKKEACVCEEKKGQTDRFMSDFNSCTWKPVSVGEEGTKPPANKINWAYILVPILLLLGLGYYFYKKNRDKKSKVIVEGVEEVHPSAANQQITNQQAATQQALTQQTQELQQSLAQQSLTQQTLAQQTLAQQQTLSQQVLAHQTLSQQIAKQQAAPAKAELAGVGTPSYLQNKPKKHLFYYRKGGHPQIVDIDAAWSAFKARYGSDNRVLLSIIPLDESNPQDPGFYIVKDKVPELVTSYDEVERALTQ